PDLLPGSGRLAPELHPGFCGQAVLLAGVAGFACSDDVLPRVRAASGPRDHVIDVLGAGAAVLTQEGVADEYRTAGQAGARAVRNPDEVLETDDRRDGNRHAFGVIRPAVLVNKLSFVLEDENERPPRAHHAERLERCVEDEGSSQRSVLPPAAAWLDKV